MPLDFGTITDTASQLPLKDILSYAVGKGILDFASAESAKLKQLIIDKYNEERYAFVPDKKEAQRLEAISKESEYIEISSLIPNYRYIDILQTGILIDEYNKESSQKAKKRVKAIRKEVATRPNGNFLIKIANLPGTPIFSTVLEYLHGLKIRGYSESQIEETFNGFVNDWQKVSLFVRNEDSQSTVERFCKKQVGNHEFVFFIFGMGKVVEKVEGAMKKLEKEKFFGDHNYVYRTIKTSESEDGGQRKMEVIVNMKNS